MEQHSGTLFQGRAKAKQIDSESSLIQVICYVHLNPVRAGLVQKPEDWRFSDYCDWIRSRLSMRDTYFANEGDYKQFVEEYQTMQKENDLQKFLFDE
jgi:putative transposase